MPVGIARDFLKKLSTVWRKKLELAKQAKGPFDDVRDQCMTFVCGGPSDFWAEEFQRKYLGTVLPAEFKISMNKAFEVLAVFGPMLYARNPVRTVYTAQPAEIEPMLFGDPRDPVAQQMYAEFAGQQQMDEIRRRAICNVLRPYLNYTPGEQPGGGLQQAGEDAISDALVGGMGLLWPRVYSMPGSTRKLTGSFYTSSQRLLADPDRRSLEFGECTWIALLHTTPVWELERMWRLAPGRLQKYAQRESSHGRAARHTHDLGNLRQIQGRTNDLVDWAEIWSTTGVGCRLNGADESLRTAFDEFIGDYAYMAIGFPGDLPFPLNCPPEALADEGVEEIQRRFRWRAMFNSGEIPFWQDSRWPCAMLRFYKHPSRQWPIAPLAPGLGELIFMNLVISRLANHVWQSSRQFLGVLQSARKEVEKALKRNESIVTVPIKDMHKALNQVVSFLQYPNIVRDIYEVYERVALNFERRTGLVEFLYATNTTQSRTATDVRAKAEKAGIRPDYMAHKVEEWLSEASSMEKLAAYWGEVSGYDVAPIIGRGAARIWDALFAGADPESINREVYCKVAAGSARKRNREQELGAVQEFYPAMSQQLTGYAQASGDSRPANELNQKLFEVLNFDGEGLEMGPWMPPQLQQGPDPEQIEHQVELRREEEEHDQKLRHKEEEHDLQLQLMKEKGDVEAQQKKKLANAQVRMARAQSRAKVRQASNA